MPIYEYKCPDCGREFEDLVIGSAPRVTCPACGGDKCDKLMSAASFLSRGEGGASGASSSGCGSCSASSCAGCGRS